MAYTRNYKKEYASYHSSPKQRKNRSMRNKARRKVIKSRGKAAVRGKDIDHKKGVGRGNKLSNLRILSKHKNRSYKRNKDRTQKR